MSLFDRIFDIKNGYANVDKIKFLPKKQFIECFDENKLIYAINNVDKLKEKYHDGVRDSLPLDDFLMASKDGKKKVRYEQASNGMYCRYLAADSLSAINMVREVRHVIYGEKYTDMDIDNCHPVIIKWMCERLDINCDNLKHYIKHRSDVFDQLISINPGKDKGFFKTLILSINNGGGDFRGVTKNKFIADYVEELKDIRKKIVDTFHVFKDKTKQSLVANKDKTLNNLYGSTISNICQFVENQLLMEIVGFLKKKLNATEFESIALCYDGIMIPKECDALGFIADIQTMMSKMGIHIKMSVKEMDSLDIVDMGYDEAISYDLIAKPCKVSAMLKAGNDKVAAKKVAESTALFEKVKARDYSANYFDHDDEYYWSDFKNELKKQIFNSVEMGGDALDFLASKMPRVCAFVDDNVVIKKGPVELYDIVASNRWASDVFVNYWKKSGNDVVKKSLPLRSYVYSNMAYFHIFNRNSCDFTHPRNDKEFDLSMPFIGRMTDETDHDLLSEFKARILEIFCEGNQEYFDFLWFWFAFTVKYPHLKTKVGLLFISPQGCGKGFLIDFFCRFIYGKHNSIPNMNGMEKLIDDKNKHLMGKKLIAVNELSSTKDNYASNSNKLKSLITEEDIMIRPLFCNAFSTTQACEFILMSNHINSVIMEETDRRWYVLSVSETYMNNKAFFGALQDNFYNQDFGNMVYTDLMNTCITTKEWYEMYIPATLKKTEIQNISKSSVLVFIDEKREGAHPKHVNTKVLWDEYMEWCVANRENKIKKTMFKPQLQAYGINVEKIKGENLYKL